MARPYSAHSHGQLLELIRRGDRVAALEAQQRLQDAGMPAPPSQNVPAYYAAAYGGPANLPAVPNAMQAHADLQARHEAERARKNALAEAARERAREVRAGTRMRP